MMPPNKYWKRKRCAYILKYGLPAWKKYLRRRRQKRYWKTPKGLYVVHKNNARKRGVAWEFTFDSWFAKWQRSGKWAKRGKKKGQYVMARIGDAGPYSESNTHIVRSETNAYATFIVHGVTPRPVSSRYTDEVTQIL